MFPRGEIGVPCNDRRGELDAKGHADTQTNEEGDTYSLHGGYGGPNATKSKCQHGPTS